MATTKTKIRQRISSRPAWSDILRWRIDTPLTTDEQKASELLFPAEDAGFRRRSALKKLFVAVATAIGLKKHVSPKAMRRTFQDLARTAAKVIELAGVRRALGRGRQARGGMDRPRNRKAARS